jgi:hypothetical protein
MYYLGFKKLIFDWVTMLEVVVDTWGVDDGLESWCSSFLCIGGT